MGVMAQEKKSEDADKDKENDKESHLNLFEEANYQTLVCGQHKDLVVWARNVLKCKTMNEKQNALQQFKDTMIAQLKHECNEDFTIGVGLGSAFKDTVSVLNNREQVIVKLIKDPLPIDCKQRTFVLKTLPQTKRDGIFRALYKFHPNQKPKKKLHNINEKSSHLQ